MEIPIIIFHYYQILQLLICPLYFLQLKFPVSIFLPLCSCYNILNNLSCHDLHCLFSFVLPVFPISYSLNRNFLVCHFLNSCFLISFFSSLNISFSFLTLLSGFSTLLNSALFLLHPSIIILSFQLICFPGHNIFYMII